MEAEEHGAALLIVAMGGATSSTAL
jgi:hypothetical protein